jgi:hypothetical protein
LTIPLLWEDPFSIKYPKNYHFIEIYLNNLNESYKIKLNEYIIHNDIFPSNTLFKYPSFIKYLNIFNVYHSVEEWIGTLTTKKEQSTYLY